MLMTLHLGLVFLNIGDYTLYFLVNNLLNLHLKHFNEFIGGRFAKTRQISKHMSKRSPKVLIILAAHIIFVMDICRHSGIRTFKSIY